MGAANGASGRALLPWVTATRAGFAPGVPAQAQQRGPPIIRDAETEQFAAGIHPADPAPARRGSPSRISRLVIINDRSFNAFVADGRRIFVNGGALMESENAEFRSSGVLAPRDRAHCRRNILARLREASGGGHHAVDHRDDF